MKVFIAAGGSGGHIFPGFAIADELKRLMPYIEIHFVGSQFGMEAQLIPKQGYPFHSLPIERLNSNAKKSQRIKGLLFLPIAFIMSLFLVLKYRPKMALGVGGFSSGPFILIASLLGVKTYIWEANAIAGMANRILAKYVSAAFILFENTKKTLAAKKFFLFGYPLRSSIAILSKRKKLSVANDKKLNLLIFGGSQGSKIINSSVQSMLEKYPEILGQFNIIHQVGDHDFIRSSNFYKSKNWDLNFIKFINDMDVKYLWADIAICRAGIGTVSEVSALGIPSLFIPLASAADNHQQKNAEVLVSAGAADILLESELNADTLAAKLKSFASSPEYLKLMSEKMKSFYNPGAAEKIACEMLQLNK